MTEQKNLVSVIIAAYNRADLLPRALLSLLSQTYQNWEGIIIDDGSTDNTLDVAKKFAKHDPRFRVLALSHGGHAYAMNEGIKDAKGKFLTFLDSDDEYLPKHLDVRVARMSEVDKPEILHGGLKVIGDTMVVDKRDTSKMISIYDEAVVAGGTFFGNIEIFKDLVGFQNINFYDSDFLDRAKKIHRVIRLTDPTYLYYRDHSVSITKEQAKIFKSF